MPRREKVQRTSITIVMIALAYVSLYYLNAIVMGTETFNGVAAWLFLPAFIRLLGFLLLGLWSIPALFVAALICVNLSLGLTSHVIVSFFLAVGAPVTLWAVRNLVGVKPSLKNLTGSRILILSVAAALGSGGAYHLGLALVGADFSAASFFTAAFGNIAGTWAVIYMLKILLTLTGRMSFPKV